MGTHFQSIRIEPRVESRVTIYQDSEKVIDRMPFIPVGLDLPDYQENTGHFIMMKVIRTTARCGSGKNWLSEH